MPLNLDDNSAQYQIKSYQPGKIKINQQTYHRSLIITPNLLIEDWEPQIYSQLTRNSFTAIIKLKPNVLLIGTGKKHEFLSLDLYGELINAKIGVEVMSTPAACRTFNALTAENRNVVAALIIN